VHAELGALPPVGAARQVLELGIIQRRAWPIHSGAAYRKVQKGERRSALLGWIKSIRFPERRG